MSYVFCNMRSQMESLKALVEDTAAQLDDELKVEVLGSYRRGAASSGDVDCLITHPRYFQIQDIGFLES